MDKQTKLLHAAREAGEAYFRMLQESTYEFDQIEQARLHAVQAVKYLQQYLESNKFAQKSANELAQQLQQLAGTSAQMIEFSLETVDVNAQTVQRMLKHPVT